MESVEVGGQRIAFTRRGHGDVLLLLHGQPGDSRIWREQLDALADDFTVVAWDAPGCGSSSDPDPPFDLTGAARCLAGFAEVLGIGRAHVLGLSWGSGLALELYRVAPNVVRSLVLASGYAGWGGSFPPDEVAPRVAAYLAAARSAPDEAWLAVSKGWFSPAAPREVVEELLAIAAEFHPDAIAAYARSFGVSDLRGMLPTIRVPTLVLHCDADLRSPLEVGRALHEAIPESELVVLRGVGHVSNMEAPRAFNDEVRRFLQSVVS